MSRFGNLFLPVLVGMSLTPQSAAAHAAEQGFILLLPTGIYATAGTLTVIASILLLSFLPGQAMVRAYRPVRLGPAINLGGAQSVTSLIAAIVFVALILVGLYGPTDPQANLLPLTIWTVWWIGLFVVQGIVFDVWRWLEPWSGLYRVLRMDGAPILTLPVWLSAWPALIIFLAFQGFVLADIAPNDPGRLAAFAAGYWAFTFAGMSLFGRRAWMSQVECFSVMFDLIGRLRPVQNDGALRVGLPGWKALEHPDLDLSRALFVLALLASGSFDGLHETFWWLAQIGINPLEFPGRSAVVWHTSIGLYGANALLIAVFGFAVWIGLRLAKAAPSLITGFNAFAITILPIALGYHFAHYFVTFAVQIQFLAATLGDPLARGWNILGFGEISVRTGFLAVPEIVKAVWLTQAGAVVFSHVIAVLMCHQVAETFCKEKRDVILIQLGIGVLMVAYTVFGLWLLASPRGA